LKNHQHYYNWTIEWEQTKVGTWDFCIGRTVIEPYQGTQSYKCMHITAKGTVDDSISHCQDIIDDIISQQNNIADKVLNIA
jgi:hypothetical protein